MVQNLDRNPIKTTQTPPEEVKHMNTTTPKPRMRAARTTKSNHAPVRTLRVTDELWDQAKHRTLREGVTMSYAINELVKLYATGRLNLPAVSPVLPRTTPEAGQ